MSIIKIDTDKTTIEIKSQHLKRKILVIDDDSTIRLLLDNFLSKSYQVTCKSNATEAIEWLENNLPDLIISDIRMPGLSGFQFLEKIRQSGYTKHTPVIILSCSERSEDRIKCYRLGSQDFLSKPFNPEELIEVIKKNLDPIHYSPGW